MRVLIYGINYHPEETGIGKYSAEMATWLGSRGHDVTVITGIPHYPKWEVPKAYRKPRWREEWLEGVRVLRAPHYVPSASRLDAKRRILLETSFHLSSLGWWLPQFLSRARYDVVLAVSPPLQTSVLPWAYSRVRRRPWVLHVQDLQVDAALNLGILRPSSRVSRLLYWLETSFMRAADRVSVISATMRERTVAKGVTENRSLLFPNWSDIDFVRPLDPDPGFRNRLGAQEGDILVLYAGNVGEKQGLEIVLDAAERLRHVPRLRFAVVGNGGARKRLEEEASRRRLGNITFRDLFAWEEVPQLLASGDIHLVIQRPEAADVVMPSKLTNILSAGRPVIVTARPGTELHKVIGVHNLGLVTPPLNAEALADAIVELESSPELRSSLGKQARAYAESFLAKERVLERFEQDLEALLTDWTPTP